MACFSMHAGLLVSPSFLGFAAVSPCRRKASLIVIHNGNVVQQVQVFTKRLKKCRLQAYCLQHWSWSPVNKMLSLLLTYYISHALPSHWMTGGIFQSKAALRNWALTENKCLTYFWKGLAIWYPLCTAESALKLGKRRRRVFSFSCNVMFESNLCFMLLWCLRKERHCMR